MREDVVRQSYRSRKVVETSQNVGGIAMSV